MSTGAAAGRPGHPPADDMGSSLDALFRPRTVAVVGASRHRQSIGGEVFHNLISSGFPGPIYPVNPAAPAVQSVRAYPSVEDVPDEIDLAVIVAPQPVVTDVVRACGGRKVRAAVVITAGFAETGAESQRLQQQLVEVVRRHDMRMLGPNCLGALNTDPAAPLNATFAPAWPPRGPVAMASQSGAVGLALLDHAADLGIGVTAFASIGNAADITSHDLLEYWEGDAATRVIVLYVEDFGNPARFLEIARRVTRRKPIVAVKSGRTAAGARAATSHSGALAGMEVAVDALLGQAGVIRTETLEELFDVTALLATQPVPAGPRVGILTNGGGPGILAADACESRGLTLPELTPGTVTALRAFLPRAAAVTNPVDMLASAPPDHYERALRLLLADERLDAVLVLFVPPLVTEARAVADAIRRAAAGAGKPVLPCLIGARGMLEAQRALRDAGMPAYAFPERAALALARAVSYGRWLRRPEGRVPPVAGVSPPQGARTVIERSREGWLSADDVREVLAAYGLRMPRSQLVHTCAEAEQAAAAVGFPVALKIVAREIPHKTEVGGVVLHLATAEQVRRAFESMQQHLAARGLSSKVQGVLVQEMVTEGVETYVGVTQAPGFGSLIGFGIGGVAVELWKDVVFRMHPVTDVDAREMLEQIRGKALLDGFRGAPAADKDALADVMLRVDRMAAENPEIQELDINPLIALPPGRGVVAVDARIRIG